MTQAPQTDQPAPVEATGPTGFWARVRDHKIIQWAIGYLGAALALAHGQELVGHAFDWPELVSRLFMILLIAGLPIALTLAWYQGHRGLRRVSAAELTIISLLVLIGAVFFTVSLRPADDVAGASEAAQAKRSTEDGREPLAAVAPSGSRQPSRAASARSIAVLPFENQIENENAAVFASGIHEQVINRLAKIKNLTVIARSAVLRYQPGNVSIREVARDLKVQAVMQSTIRFAEGNVRISAQVSDTDTDATLWAETYTRPFEHVFDLETDLATQIAAALATELAPGEQRSLARQSTTSAEAYAQFLRALAAYSSSAGGVGVTAQESAEFHRHLDRALELDPDFALGYAAKARDYAYSMARYLPRASGLSFEDRAALATRNAERALSLDPENGLAYAALAGVHRMSGRFREAQLAMDKALALAPNDYQVVFDSLALHFVTRDGATALEYARRAARLNPPEGFLPMGLAFVAAGDYAAAAEQFRPHAEYPTMPLEYARAELLRGDKASTLESLHEQEKRGLRPPAAIPSVAYMYRVAGAENDARRLSATLPAFAEDYAVGPGDWALAALASGRPDEALTWLRRSVERGVVGVDAQSLAVIVRNTYSDPVLEQPMFVELRNRLPIGGRLPLGGR
jgi:TolB-like protein